MERFNNSFSKRVFSFQKDSTIREHNDYAILSKYLPAGFVRNEKDVYTVVNAPSMTDCRETDSIQVGVHYL